MVHIKEIDLDSCYSVNNNRLMWPFIELQVLEDDQNLLCTKMGRSRVKPATGSAVSLCDSTKDSDLMSCLLAAGTFIPLT